MSDLKQAGFQTGDILAQLNSAIQSFSDGEKKDLQKKTNTIFELQIKNKEGVEATWTIDVKNEPKIHKGAGTAKPGVTLIMADETFQALAGGKLDGQRAFMSGKLKTKGNMMLATKLDGVLKAAKAKAKL
ncbi:sterol-binding-like protein [Thelephora terrestris]|uniref:Sterol-binding-like protein n=1 Tax=Thelephora terrestris TaxID=56493 RepID=A0A9P6H3Y8_9AGAM|nr:sterol-binding-like protein [Thelephora terrestris]